MDELREELKALTRAAAAHARRQRALGVRREAAQAKQKPAPGDGDAAAPLSESAPSGPARSAEDVRSQAAACRTLDELRAAVAQCEACTLCETRTQTVFMDGQGTSGLFFVGEAPGADEDRQGVPFVGRAGQLLTDIITKGMGIPRADVTIANVLKCRPPNNREPSPDEKATCTPWLDRQVELVDPKMIIPLGRHAAMHVLQEVASMGAMRGRVHVRNGRKIVPTFHPAYLLRSPGEKKECWKDIQVAMREIGLVPPPPRAADEKPPPSDKTP
ncbi:MAG: uracil-DNA glycosylase family protein [Planctomycetota bacterium]